MTTNRQCRHCAAFVTHGSWCYEWRKDVSPTYSCSRWHSATGVDGAEWPVMLRVSIEEKRVIEDRRQEGLAMGEHPMLRRHELCRLIIDEGMTHAEAEERMGVKPGYTGKMLQKAVALGEIERVSHGVYRWVAQGAEGDRPDAAAEEIVAPRGVGDILARLEELESTIEDLGADYEHLEQNVLDPLAKLSKAVEGLAKQVDALRHRTVEYDRALDALEADVVALRPDDAITIGPVTVRGPVDRQTLAQVVSLLAQSALGGGAA